MEIDGDIVKIKSTRLYDSNDSGKPGESSRQITKMIFSFCLYKIT